ncbi:MAG: phenylalanine--tRNA ligase subunit alpha [Flavobacteriales bacterium]
MREQIDKLVKEIKAFKASTKEEIEDFRIEYLGAKKGKVNALFRAFKDVPSELKKEFGQHINQLKQLAHEAHDKLKSEFESESESSSTDVDFTLPGYDKKLGSRHPISIVRNEIIEIFNRIGFSISEGPEIEDDWHNFSALNLPPEHPARDMQDTFFVQTNPDWMLRTHTSSVQIRHMERQELPIRTISPGRVFRNEAISARAHCIFHQIEGLYIDKDVSFADLKQTILYFVRAFFGKDSKIRLRPSYFPFTEPSAEVDVYWGLETEADYKITKGTGWLEIMGCGMVDPQVLKNLNIDPETHSGFAFGMGLERIAMLKYQISDLRMFFENDSRFINQFKHAVK